MDTREGASGQIFSLGGKVRGSRRGGDVLGEARRRSNTSPAKGGKKTLHLGWGANSMGIRPPLRGTRKGEAQEEDRASEEKAVGT